jgi:hypothetical protein
LALFESDPNRDDGHEPDYKPELICRTFVGDTGGRPLDPSDIFYESPDIWVTAPDGSDIPVAGVVNKVHVHVWNLGLAPAYGVRVEVYWCNPAVGVNLASATAIGVAAPITLNGGEHKILTFDWTPDFVNDGHECLVAQVYDPVSDNLVAPFNPVLDRHVAQHNVNLVRMAVGRRYDLHFYVANLSGQPEESELSVEPVTGAALQRLASGWGLGDVPEFQGAAAAITEITAADARPTLDLARHPAAAVFRETLEPAARPYTRALLHGALGALPTSDHKKVVSHRQIPAAGVPVRDAISRTLSELRALPLPPGKTFRITLSISIPEAGRKGTFAAFRVIERVARRMTGGISYLIQLV